MLPVGVEKEHWAEMDYDYPFYKSHHCMKNVRIWSFSGPYFPAFGMYTERYGLSLRIKSKCGKIQTRKTPNLKNTVPFSKSSCSQL